ncbi:hypothetical protein GF342_03790 [Candidatus Woesearchaeota archaeon]|nr:hypothetical protein [Candidatus Woesearchaeota archaeon]
MKAILLLSGGFDSIVAYDMLKKYYEIDAIHFHYAPITDKKSTEKALALAKHIGLSRVHVCAIAPVEAEILKHCDKKHFFVLSKRSMMRIAALLAKELGAEALITGESLGQVASQTLQHLAIIADAVPLPVLRPLLTWNKEEIIQHSRRIGTYDIAKGPEMCNILGPKHPATNATLRAIQQQERNFDKEQLAQTSYQERELILLHPPL